MKVIFHRRTLGALAKSCAADQKAKSCTNVSIVNMAGVGEPKR